MDTRRRRHLSFFRAVVGLTLVTHVVFALAVRELAAWAGLPHANAVATAAALVAFAALPVGVRFLPNRRGRWLALVQAGYLAHWCAALGATVPVAAYLIVGPVVMFMLGRSFEAPGSLSAGAYAGMFGLAVWGTFLRPRLVRVRRLEIQVANLPPEFDGYRIVQLSDLHIGRLLPAAWAARWVALANAETPDLIAVTGDLVASGNDYHAEVGDLIGTLKAPDGVQVVMGNHDYFGDGEALVSRLQAQGVSVLRNRGITVERARAAIHVAGLDDTWSGRADLARALRGRSRGRPTILLAHDPAVYPHATKLGVELVLSGHTHGGQVAVPFLARSMSLANLTHRHHLGLYRDGRTALYVHPGLGTTGPPIRIGVPPEITVIVLRPTLQSNLARVSCAPMPWVEAQLHGQRVYARATADGTFAANGSFVEVCYRRDAGRVYRARVSNLVRSEDAVLLPDDACAPQPAKSPSRSSPSRVAPANVAQDDPSPASASTTPEPNPSVSVDARDTIVVYADGACSGNPGPAGLGVVVLDGETRTEISEYLGTGTNNIAELTAIERALDAVGKSSRPVVIHTDSSYSIGVLSKGWKAKANVELVKRLKARLEALDSVRFVYVRGHAGIPLNERVDELAREAVRSGKTRTERIAAR